MSCSQCGRPLLPEAKFCGYCGRAVPGSSTVDSLVQGALSVPLREVILIDAKTTTEIVKSPVFRFLCLFALTPLALTVLRTSGLILNGLSIWVGVFWGMLIFRFFADRELHFGWAVGTLLFTSFVMLPLFEVYLGIPPQITERLIVVDFLPVRFLGFVFGVGFREEMCKALPLIGLALLSSRMKNPLNGLVLGMMSGIGFAISENVYYVHHTHDEVVNAFLQHIQRTSRIVPQEFEDYFLFPVYNNMVRMMSGPFGHGIYSGIFGYFISLAAADRHRRVGLFFVGLLLSSLIHGTYDTVAGSALFGVGVKAFGFFLLMTYVLKARGLTTAQDLGAGLFQRTVIRQIPAIRPAPAPIVAAAPKTPTTPAPELPTLSLIEETAAGSTLVSAKTWALRGIDGSARGHTYRLETEVRIGRDGARCKIHLGELTVSREHAQIVPDGLGWRIRRLSATSPLYVNGQAVDDVGLKAEDQIQLGNSVLVVEAPST